MARKADLFYFLFTLIWSNPIQLSQSKQQCIRVYSVLFCARLGSHTHGCHRLCPQSAPKVPAQKVWARVRTWRENFSSKRRQSSPHVIVYRVCLYKLDVERREKGDGSKKLLAQQMATFVITVLRLSKHANLKSYINVKYSLPYKESIL